MFKSHEAKKYFKNLFLASTKLILRLSIENLIGIRIRLEFEIGSNPPPQKKHLQKYSTLFGRESVPLYFPITNRQDLRPRPSHPSNTLSNICYYRFFTYSTYTPSIS